MKKWFLYFIIMLMSTNLAACGTVSEEPIQKEEPQLEETPAKIDVSETETKEVKEETVESNKMKIQIGSTSLTATLENNTSVDALKELLREAPLTIEFSQYGGFEQVGNIGTNLPENNTQITTSAGDIVLYGGNQMVMFYGSNSWSYTQLGVIDSLSKEELTELLGTSSVTVTFSLE